jgi:transcriptional regulator with PAS, ATPase and Fis domain
MQNYTATNFPTGASAIKISDARSSAIINNRLEALKVLSNSLLNEIEAFQIKVEPIKHNEIDLLEEVKRFEIGLIRSALVQTYGKQSSAAKLLKIKLTTLNAKIKRYRIEINIENK